MNIYVGNIPRSTDEQTIRELFEEYGSVSEVKLLRDRYTGELRGFGFVTMESDEEAQNAIDNINETELGGRTLVVNKARPRTERPNRGGYGNRNNSQRSW